MLSADEATRNAAEELLDVTNFEELVDNSIMRTVEVLKSANPEFVKAEAALTKFFTEVLNHEALRKEAVDMYEKVFTEDELKDITAFYMTEAGRKTLEKMPEILNETLANMQKRLAENTPKLEEVIRTALEETSAN